MATGVSGAALIGVGVLLAAHPGTPTEAAPEVQLASFGSALAPPPLSPFTTTPWWLTGGGNDGASSRLFETGITPNALAAAVRGGAGFNVFNPSVRVGG